MEPCPTTTNCNPTADEARPGSPDKYIKKRQKGSILTSQERRMVLNVYGNLRKENPKWSVFDAALKASVLCGVSVSTLIRIKNEFLKSDGKLVTPGLTRVGTKKKYNTDSITLMKSKLANLFGDNKKPTLNYVMDEFKRDPAIPTIARGRVFNMIKAMGFKDNLSAAHNPSCVPVPKAFDWKWNRKLRPCEPELMQNVNTVGQQHFHQLTSAAMHPPPPSMHPPPPSMHPTPPSMHLPPPMSTAPSLPPQMHGHDSRPHYAASATL